MSTTVVYGDTVEGGIGSADAVYANARAGAGLFGSASLLMGQYGAYNIYEAFLRFDTSFLGTDTITSAVLSLYVNNNSSVTDFIAEARLHPWGATLETADWVAGASLSGLTLLATLDTSAVTGAAYNDFTDVALPANINKTGFTNIMLSSSNHRLGNAPTADEYLGVDTKANGGTTTGPKLTIVSTSVAASISEDNYSFPMQVTPQRRTVMVFS